MSKVVKIKQKDIEDIVNTLLEDITEQSDTDVVDQPELVDEPESGTTDTSMMNPSVVDIMKRNNLEIRPGTDEKSRNGSKIGLGKDSSGNVYVVDYTTNKILGIKKA